MVEELERKSLGLGRTFSLLDTRSTLMAEPLPWLPLTDRSRHVTQRSLCIGNHRLQSRRDYVSQPRVAPLPWESHPTQPTLKGLCLK